MNRYWFSWCVLMVVATLCLMMIMGVSYAIWGPHTPPQPLNSKQEFVNACEYKQGVPDVHNNDWTCRGIEQ